MDPKSWSKYSPNRTTTLPSTAFGNSASTVPAFLVSALAVLAYHKSPIPKSVTDYSHHTVFHSIRILRTHSLTLRVEKPSHDILSGRKSFDVVVPSGQVDVSVLLEYSDGLQGGYQPGGKPWSDSADSSVDKRVTRTFQR